MKIGIDLRVLPGGRRTGVEEYILNLVPYLISEGRDIEWILFYNAFFKKDLMGDWLSLPNVRLVQTSYPNKLLDWTSFVFGLPKIDKLIGGVDKFFMPHFLGGEVSKNCKKIITFHDVSFLHHPEFFSLKYNIAHKVARPGHQAKKADAIIVDSISTKQDVANFFKVEASKVSVVPLGVGSQFAPLNDAVFLKEIKQKYHLPDKFILYLGTIEPRKNIIGIVKAFEIFKKDFKQYSLVLAGSLGWKYKEILTVVKNSSVAKDIHLVGFIEEGDKVGIYNLADLFLYPSFFEGFGLPPLEAMACGVPVVTSNRSSLSEVVGESAIMVDPYNIAEIAFAMKEVMADKQLYDSLKNQGLVQAKKFYWMETAKKTLQVLKNA